MKYYLYQIRNNLNNKIYVGVHKTANLNDGYMGSGKIIRSAIAKHSIDNFTKVILEFFENAELMYAREKEIVTDEFLLREDVYNLRRGGHGGFDYINKNTSIKEYSRRGKLGAKEGAAKRLSTMDRDDIINHMSNMRSKVKNYDIASWQEAAKTKEAIEKRKSTFKEISHQSGKNNSQFGTMWITNGVENRKIKKAESVPEGWNKGRIIIQKRIKMTTQVLVSQILDDDIMQIAKDPVKAHLFLTQAGIINSDGEPSSNFYDEDVINEWRKNKVRKLMKGITFADNDEMFKFFLELKAEYET